MRESKRKDWRARLALAHNAQIEKGLLLSPSDVHEVYALTQAATEGQEELIEALRKIAEFCPAVEPEAKDRIWGNEDDAEYHGWKSAAWTLGSIARAVLARYPRASSGEGWI